MLFVRARRCSCHSVVFTYGCDIKRWTVPFAAHRLPPACSLLVPGVSSGRVVTQVRGHLAAITFRCSEATMEGRQRDEVGGWTNGRMCACVCSGCVQELEVVGRMGSN